MKKTVTVISFKATKDDLTALDAIREDTRDTGSNKFATRADCMRIALAHALTLLKQPAQQS
jgi:hypothetical protein